MEIPKGWEIVRLGDVCSFEYGKALKAELRHNDGSFPVVGSNGCVGFHNECLVKGPGIVIGRKGAVGEVTFVSKNFWPIDTTYFLKLSRDLLLLYFFFLLKYLRLSRFDKSTAIPGLNRNDAYGQVIPLPPLPEQHRIVAKIEELFSSLDKGIESLKTAQQQLKVYRQAVLKWAFEGKLTNKNVVDGELPEGWKLLPLKQIGKWTGGGTPSKRNKHFWEEGSIFWVSPKDMKSKVIKNTTDKITPEGVDNSSAKLIEQGSVLFVVRSGILRRMLPVAIAQTTVTVNQDLQAFTPHIDLPDYIYWCAQAFNNDIRERCSKDGTTVESIETSLLKNYSIPLASLPEQHAIVAEIESRLSVCDKIEESIGQGLKQAESLRQSILKKAFEGKLVPQDPNDEPANVLLDRIRKERSELPSTKAKARRRK